MEDKIIVALDVSEKERAEKIIEKLSSSVKYFKVGLELYSSEGNNIVKEIKSKGLRVFLDLKLHDIPNTVSNTIRNIAELKPSMVTVHTLGGGQMLEAAVAAARESYPEMKILGVTVLTSLDKKSLFSMGIEISEKDLVSKLAKLAFDSGCDGIVCSAQDLGDIREEYPPPFLVVIPGIRLPEDELADQRKVSHPCLAFEKGADFIVLGRSITNKEQPELAIKRLLEICKSAG